MNDQKSNYYTQLILKALLNKEMVTTGQLAEEIGLSEKTIRTKVEVINNMLLDNQLGEICKKPRIGIWLDANEQQRLKLNSLIKMCIRDSNISLSVQVYIEMQGRRI